MLGALRNHDSEKRLLVASSGRLPLPQPVRHRPRESMARLTSYHDDLTAVMALMRDEIGEHVADVEGQVAPHVSFGWRDTGISQTPVGRLWIRWTVIRLLVLQAAISVARKSGSGGN